MLRNFDNRLNADVIRALRAMGHGDDLVICDTNFPADATARQTRLGKLLRMDGCSAAEAQEQIAIVSATIERFAAEIDRAAKMY